MPNVKLVVVGDRAVGKSCLLITYTTNAFPGGRSNYTRPVFDRDFANITVDRKPFHVELWVATSQQQHYRLRRVYPQTDVFLACFCVERPESLASITAKWVPEVRHSCPDAHIVLVACKIDLRRSAGRIKPRHCVTYDEGYAEAKKIKALAYVETSALTQEGLDECFDQVIRSAKCNTSPRQTSKGDHGFSLRRSKSRPEIFPPAMPPPGDHVFSLRRSKSRPEIFPPAMPPPGGHVFSPRRSKSRPEIFPPAMPPPGDHGFSLRRSKSRPEIFPPAMPPPGDHVFSLRRSKSRPEIFPPAMPPPGGHVFSPRRSKSRPEIFPPAMPPPGDHGFSPRRSKSRPVIFTPAMPPPGGGQLLPDAWTRMGSNQNLLLVRLTSGSEEYNKVKQNFRNGGAPHKIKKIDRIQNKRLYQQYAVTKKAMESSNPKGLKNEKRLFHGTSTSTVPKINENGFNRSYCGKNATAYGEGVYFATTSSYSVRFTAADTSSRSRKMYQARVLVGESTLSRQGMKALPNKQGTIIPYDSGTDGRGMYIIFHDCHAYPEYLITF